MIPKSKDEDESEDTSKSYEVNTELEWAHDLDGITCNMRYVCTSFEAIVVAAFKGYTPILVKQGGEA